MRIIAGKFKSKKLREFELITTRPTSDMVRGAIFNMLGTKIVDSDFLDLFAGTGAVGIEALSRGAKSVCFVDREQESIKLINQNLQLVGATNCQLFKTEFDVALKNFANKNMQFDIVFIDPPYKSECAEQAIKQIASQNLLKPFGQIVWEHDSDKLSLINSNILHLKTKKYGKKYVTILDEQNLKMFINILNNA